MLDGLDLDFDDVDGVLEHGVVALLGAEDLDLGEKVEAVHLAQKLHRGLLLDVAQGRQLLQVPFLGLHELVVDLLQEQVLLLAGLEDQGAAVALAVLDREGVLVVEVLLILHDLAPVPEGDTAEHPGPLLAAFLGHDELGAEEVEGALEHLALHGEEGGGLLEDELDPGLLDGVREEEGALDLADLVAIDDLVELLVVGVIDFLKRG